MWDITVLMGNMTSNLPPLSPLPSDDSPTPPPLSPAYSLQSRPSASLLTYWLILALTISSAQTHTHMRTRVDTNAVCIHCKCHHAAFKIRQLQAWKSLDKVVTAGGWRHSTAACVEGSFSVFCATQSLKWKNKPTPVHLTIRWRLVQVQIIPQWLNSTAWARQPGWVTDMI